MDLGSDPPNPPILEGAILPFPPPRVQRPRLTAALQSGFCDIDCKATDLRHLQWDNGAPYCMQEVPLLMTPFCLGIHRVSTAFGNPCLALSLTWALFVQSWRGGGGLDAVELLRTPGVRLSTAAKGAYDMSLNSFSL